MRERINLAQLDELTLRQHQDLDSTDKCYHWHEYTVGQNYNYSETNQLIKNFKINPTERYRLEHKSKAIEQISQELCCLYPKVIRQNYLYVPIPPSKPKEHLDYDNRLTQVLCRVATLEACEIDVKELVQQSEETTPDHLAKPGERHSVEELLTIYQVNQNLLAPKPTKVVIFDDVLTKGTHFKAMQTILRNYYHNIEILGLFIARSVNPL